MQKLIKAFAFDCMKAQANKAFTQPVVQVKTQILVIILFSRQFEVFRF